MEAVDARGSGTSPESDENGFVIVWMAIVLFLLIAIAAFAVDLVHAYVEAEKAQKAADSAALAGAISIPDDLNGQAAHDQAMDLAQKNGYGAADVTKATIDPVIHNQMDVTVRHTFDTFFAQIMGIKTLTVQRSATAQYDAPLTMGSPANNLGDIPWGLTANGTTIAGSCDDLGYTSNLTAGATDAQKRPCANQPKNGDQNLFLQIEGPDTAKSSGNAFTTNFCSVSKPTDGCTGFGGTNNEWKVAPGDTVPAEYFMIHDDDPTKPLTVALYDAAFVATGFNSPCSDVFPIGGLIHPERHYAKSPFCAEDSKQTASSAGPMNTHYRLMEPDTDNDPTNNNVPVAGCPQLDLNGVFPDLIKGPNLADSPNGPQAVPYFEQWKTLCTVAGPNPDISLPYVLKVWSDAGGGSNSFSVLALHKIAPGPPAAPSAGLQAFARQHLPLYALKPDGGAASFYVAVLPSTKTNRALELKFFDIGDTPVNAGSNIKLSIESSPDVSGLPSQCTYTVPPGSAVNGAMAPLAPWGELPADNQTSNPCLITASPSTSWNGQWVTVEVPIPTSYHCDTTISDGCWIKLKMDPGAGVPIDDATTWDAQMAGAPVRLVSNP